MIGCLSMGDAVRWMLAIVCYKAGACPGGGGPKGPGPPPPLEIEKQKKKKSHQSKY